MINATVESLKQYVGFTPGDAQNIRSLAEAVLPEIPRIVDRFYEVLLSRRESREVFRGGQEQLQRLHGSLCGWMTRMFEGPYDEAYFLERAQVGRVHVRVGLPQHLMFGAMEILRQGVERAMRSSRTAREHPGLESLRKLFALELAVMLESYKDSYAEQVRDIERTRMQERLTRAQHLAKIGELAASLAHEIKNPLAGISGAIQVIRDSMDPAAPHRPILAEVLRQIDRLDGTVKDLLVYARPVPPRFQPCELKRVVERCFMVARRESELGDIRFESYVDGRTPSIEADERQIEQLLMNLVLNAAQASHAGAAVRVRARVEGPQVVLRVEDDGTGMDAETCRRAFEPFMTTKSRGTGLGLSICEKIVELHGGSIHIDSALGKGTAVTVRLPIEQPIDALGGSA
ncbi:MAG: hypothetical protein HRF50_04035 [Phycisphaerae bacterium]